MSLLGTAIKTLRTEQKLTLQEVADAADLSRAHIWELEQGRSDNPRVSVLCQLAGALNVSPTHLFIAAIPERF